MNKLVIGNLLHRPLRTLISVVAVSIEVVMILSIVAVMVGQVSNASHQTGGIGADIIMQPPGSSFIASVGGAPVPAKIADVLAKLPHVAVASPEILHLNTSGSVETIWGIDYESFNALRPFRFISGGPFTGPNDVIVDDYYARSAKKGESPRVVGATVEVIPKHSFRICGIVEHGKGGRVFLPIRTLGALLGNANNASLFYIKADDQKNDELIRSEIHAKPGLADYQVQTLQEYFSQMTPDHLPGFNIALRAVITIAVIVGFLVIFQSMYTAVLERTREIGILKSMGASKTYIVNVVLRETALVTVVGVVLGIALAEALKVFLGFKFPTLPFPITAEWRVRGAVIALIGSLLGALYPAWKAASKDPIDALAYE